MKLDKYQLLRDGVYIQKITPEARLVSLIEKLRPVRTGQNLIRIGASNDGGYLIPDDLAGISACFSPGVGPTAEFEIDLLSKFNIQSHLCDYSVSVPPGNFKPASFERKFIGSTDQDHFTTLNSWMERNEELTLDTDFLLQMDIEGGEYAALLSLDENNLKRFRIIVVEFHNVEHWSDPVFFEIVESTFLKLLKHFHVVHIHPNNYGKLINLDQVVVPDTFELSLIRKDRCIPVGYTDKLPHDLDRPCDPQRPELILPDYWYKTPTNQFFASAIRSKFDKIYRGRQWGGTPDRMSSGPGSRNPRIVAPYVTIVRQLIKDLNCRKLVDLGCGDLNVGQYFLHNCDSYLACDASDAILRQNMTIYDDPKLTFQNVDITKDALPTGDVAFVRQVLQHLSNYDISLFVEALQKSRPYRFLLVTEHIPEDDSFVANIDMATGRDIRLFSGSGVELDKPPFSLKYKSKTIVLEVEEPVNSIPARIRTTLFEFN